MGIKLKQVMQSEHGQHHLAMRLMLLFLTMMVWECQCSMHGQKTSKNCRHFGYDANSDAVAAIGEGYGGTISQHADVQAYLTLRVLRNSLDGVDIDTGIGTADRAGNCLTEGEDYRYSEEDRSYYALNVAVTADNYKDFTNSAKFMTRFLGAADQEAESENYG